MTSGAPTLSSLLSRADLTDHDEILKAANAALRKSRSDVEAQHARAVALLKLDRFEDAARAIEEGGNTLKARAPLEYAYALYKTGSLAEATDVALQHASDAQDRGLLHVLAQTSYRLEDFAKAAKTYEGLTSRLTGSEHEVNDLRVNGAAVDAQLEWSGSGHLVTKKKPAREDLEAFETAYNAACGSIARGELAQGEVLLKRAQDLCQANDELSVEDKQAEIMPILVQRIYVLLRLGRHEEAGRLTDDITVAEIPDMSTRHIAHVNTLMISQDTLNPFLAHRTFHSTQEGTKSDRPFGHQARALKEDASVLDLLSYKYQGVESSTTKFLVQNPTTTTSPTINSAAVINAAASARNAVGKAGVKALLPLMERRPNDVGLLLTIVQLYVLTNNHSSALALLEAFFSRLEQSSTPADQDVRFAPGLVATAISLYAAQSRRAQVRGELARAAAYWQERYKSTSNPQGIRTATTLVKAAGLELLNNPSEAEQALAASLFAQLYTALPSDPASTAGLVASHATTKPSDLPQSALDALPEGQRLVVGIDAVALEQAGVAALPIPESTAGKREASERQTKEKKAEEPQKKKRKLSAKRTPKDFVAGKEMDPERWLPLRDRTYYKPKGKKKNKAKLAGGTQGGVVEDEAEGGKGAGAPQANTTGGGGTKKKNKKKGGAKW